MKRLVILGASGHGRVAADIAGKNGYDSIAFLDASGHGEAAVEVSENIGNCVGGENEYSILQCRQTL